MTESTRTIAYVVVAAASVAVAWFASPPLDFTPEELREAKINTPFYSDFNANDATSIRVVDFDENRALAKPFAVEFKNGLWTIPSHHSYPADGKDQLAKTAASTIGIKRDEFRSASKDDHAEFGVVDPSSDDVAQLKGRGKRITLSKGEEVLFDLIVGKQVRDRPGHFFVRKPGENATYAAKLDLVLSTKFGDWVETDLLKLNRDALIEMVLDNYSISIEGGRGRLVPGEDLKLQRPKSADPWKLVGLDEETEELDTKKIDDMVSTLDDLKLVGVRSKPKGLKPDMTLDREALQGPFEAQVLASDLSSKGYELVSSDRNNPQQLKMYSRQGELNVATNEGVVYTLRFGEIFSGDEAEVEAGADDEKTKKKAAKEEDEGDAEKKSASGQSSRYVFVTTRFDDKYLGDAPVEPERPEGVPADEPKPAETKKPEAKADNGKTLPQGAKKASVKKVIEPDDDAPAAGPAVDDDDDKPAADDPAAKPADDAPVEKPKSPEQLKREYETLKQKYQADLKAFEGKVKAGNEKVDELNRRFGDWYYVISADSFNKLHLSRMDLVKEKTKAADAKPGAGGDDPAELIKSLKATP